MRGCGTTFSGTRFAPSSGANAIFRDATFCGAKVEDADFNGAALEGALIPAADTTVADLIAGQPDVACARVDIGTKPLRGRQPVRARLEDLHERHLRPVRRPMLVA